jgi:hypothetical protein
VELGARRIQTFLAVNDPPEGLNCTRLLKVALSAETWKPVGAVTDTGAERSEPKTTTDWLGEGWFLGAAKAARDPSMVRSGRGRIEPSTAT